MRLRVAGILLLLLPGVLAAPARADWAPVPAIPAADVYSFFARGDTLLAGAGTLVWTSTDGGGSWSAGSAPAPTVQSVDALWFRDGRIWAGSFANGVFTSDDLGVTWAQRNDGLTGGLFGSHLYVDDFEQRGDSLFACTAGAGVYVTRLSGPVQWTRFGDAFQTWVSENVVELGAHGDTLFAAAGANGYVFSRAPGEGDWSALAPIAPAPAGLEYSSLASAGGRMFAGSQRGIHRRALPGAPWEYVGLQFGGTVYTRLAAESGLLYAALHSPVAGTRVFGTGDLGQNWVPLGTFAPFAYDLVCHRGVLWAARVDGLWRRESLLSAPPPALPQARQLMPAAPNPVRAGGRTALRLLLPAAASVRVEVHAITGQRVASLVRGRLEAGTHDLEWATAGVAPGIYVASASGPGFRAVRRIAVVR